MEVYNASETQLQPLKMSTLCHVAACAIAYRARLIKSQIAGAQ
jgi:hypothetical protein